MKTTILCACWGKSGKTPCLLTVCLAIQWLGLRENLQPFLTTGFCGLSVEQSPDGWAFPRASWLVTFQKYLKWFRIANDYLVGGLVNMNFIFPCIGNNNPNWLSYFSEGFKPPTRIKWWCMIKFAHFYYLPTATPVFFNIFGKYLTWERFQVFGLNTAQVKEWGDLQPATQIFSQRSVNAVSTLSNGAPIKYIHPVNEHNYGKSHFLWVKQYTFSTFLFKRKIICFGCFTCAPAHFLFILLDPG